MRATLGKTSAVLFTLATAALAGCATGGAGTKRGASWLKPCKVAGVSTPVRCGTYEVFENREARSGRKVGLKVIVLPATGKNRAPDPVVYFGGGPGESVTEYAADYANENPLRERRDIVLVDVRGTGGSNPLFCPYQKDGSRQLGLLVREHQGGSQVDAGRRVRPGGLAVGVELEAEAGMAAAPVDADDALLVEDRQMALHLALAAADPAGQSRVGHAQHRQSAPAGLRQELQQDLEGVARGFAQGSAPGRGVDGHAGLAHGRQSGGEALVAGGALAGASLAFLPLGADDASAGGILAVVWPWVCSAGVLGLHLPVRTLTGAFLGERGRSARDVQQLSRLHRAGAAARLRPMVVV